MIDWMTAMQPNTEDNIKQVNITKNCTQGNNQDLCTYIKTSPIIYPITYVSLTFFNTFLSHKSSIDGGVTAPPILEKSPTCFFFFQACMIGISHMYTLLALCLTTAAAIC